MSTYIVTESNTLGAAVAALSEYGEKVQVVQGLDQVEPGSIVFWMLGGDPSVVKHRDRTAILVVWKSWSEERSFADLMDYGLSVKANLLVECRNDQARVLDPLGNCLVPFTTDMVFVAAKALHRAQQLQRFVRVPSIEVGAAVEPPDEEHFYSLVRDLAVQFDRIIPRPTNRQRATGNASFRCQRGFPGMRGQRGLIFVSRRNADKAHIDKQGFVAVDASPDGPIHYYGPNKPSVDTPVQRALFAIYRNVQYIIHGHVYVEGAPFTRGNIPCGAFEEVQEILAVAPDTKQTNFAVNLRGHGCVLFAGSDLDVFKTAVFRPRPAPEPA